MPAVAGDLLGNGSIYWTCCIWRCLLAVFSVISVGSSLLHTAFLCCSQGPSTRDPVSTDCNLEQLHPECSHLCLVPWGHFCRHLCSAEIHFQLSLARTWLVYCPSHFGCHLSNGHAKATGGVNMLEICAHICVETCLSRRCQEWSAGDGHFSFLGETLRVGALRSHCHRAEGRSLLWTDVLSFLLWQTLWPRL